ncbi:ABC transporter permease [Bacteroides heparinolyticus]
MIYRLAWKNIWRNKLRSGIIMGAIGIGMFAGTFLVGLFRGWSTSVLQEHLDMQTSCIQIHKDDDEAINDINSFFPEQLVVAALKRMPEVTGFSTRLKVNAMLTSAKASTGVTLLAVDPEQEKRISRIYATIPDSAGSFLADPEAKPIVISQETAQLLKVRLRSKIILNIQDCSGEVQSTLFRVGGFFTTHSKRFDLSMAYVRKSDLSPYLMMPEGMVHEIALMTDNPKLCREQAIWLSQSLPEQLKAESWSETFPVLTVGLFWINTLSYALLVVFLTALSFGIVNIMQMAVLERNKEFKMLGCIGMAPHLILKMVMLETCLLTGVGAIIGTGLAAALVAITAKTGIHIGMLFNLKFAYGFGEVIYPELSIASLGTILLLVSASALISAILPMQKALKIMK